MSMAQTARSKRSRKQPPAWHASVAGAAGGVAMVLLGHPFDLVKVRLQAGTPSVLQSMWRSGGVRAFFRGVSLPVVGVVPVFSAIFGTYDAVLAWRCQDKGLAPGGHALSDVAAAGFTAGFLVAWPLAPGERIKCLLQVAHSDGGSRNLPFENPAGAVRYLWNKGGSRALAQGTGATVARECVSNPVFFLANVSLRKHIGGDGSDPISSWKVALAGGGSGSLQVLAMQPFDTIKSRVQCNISSVRYRDVVGGILEKEGLAGFYRGLTPAMARAFPASAACWLTVEATMRLLSIIN